MWRWWCSAADYNAKLTVAGKQKVAFSLAAGEEETVEREAIGRAPLRRHNCILHLLLNRSFRPQFQKCPNDFDSDTDVCVIAIDF